MSDINKRRNKTGLREDTVNNSTVDLLLLATHCINSTLLASHPIKSLTGKLKSNQTFVHSKTNSDLETISDSDSPRIKKRMKTDGTIITDADGLAQRIIYNEIHSLNPRLYVIGEECESEMEMSHEEVDGSGGTTSHEDKNTKESLFLCNGNRDERRCNAIRDELDNVCSCRNLIFANKTIDSERVVIFVDPLDGTSAYAKGNFEAVTILVAILVDSIPVFGVICKPFAAGIMKHEYDDSDCTVVYGGPLVGGAFFLGAEELPRSQSWNEKSLENRQEFLVPVSSENNPIHWKNSSLPPVTSSEQEKSSQPSSLEKASHTSESPSSEVLMRVHSTAPPTETEKENEKSSDHNQQWRAIISKSRGGGVVQKCIQSLSSKLLIHQEPLYITGAGYKTMKLLLGERNEALWFFPKPGTSLWDVAAADALLRVMGGKISDSLGRDLNYKRCIEIAKINGNPRSEAENKNGIIACCDLELHAKCLEFYKEESWDDCE